MERKKRVSLDLRKDYGPSSLLLKSALKSIKAQRKSEKFGTRSHQKDTILAAEDKSICIGGKAIEERDENALKTSAYSKARLASTSQSNLYIHEAEFSSFNEVKETYGSNFAHSFFKWNLSNNESDDVIPAPIPSYNSFDRDISTDVSVSYIPPPTKSSCSRLQEFSSFSSTDPPPYDIDSDEDSDSNTLIVLSSPSLCEEDTESVKQYYFNTECDEGDLRLPSFPSFYQEVIDLNKRDNFFTEDNYIDSILKMPSSPSFYQEVTFSHELYKSCTKTDSSGYDAENSGSIENIRKLSSPLSYFLDEPVEEEGYIKPPSSILLDNKTNEVFLVPQSECFSSRLCTENLNETHLESSKDHHNKQNSSRRDSEGYWSTNETSLNLSNSIDSNLHSSGSPQPPNVFENLGCESCDAQEILAKEKEKSNNFKSLPSYLKIDIINFKLDSGFIDSHCHLDFLFKRQRYQGTHSDYQVLHKKSYPKTFDGCIAVFCDPFTFPRMNYLEKHLSPENVWGSIGCHPHFSKDYGGITEGYLLQALSHPKVKALGEIGLDYSNRNNCAKQVQHEVFRRQLKIAYSKMLPLVIHCRDANEDTMAIMKEILPADYLIHLHCFTDDWDWAEKWMNAFPNLFIGITNLVTFNSAEPTHYVAKKIPLDRLLLETDAPYFVPRMCPRNTRYSHPGMAIHVAAQIAVIRNVSLSLILHWTRKNTSKMYGV